MHRHVSHGEIQRETDIAVIYIFLQPACICVHRDTELERWKKNSNIVNKKINYPIEKWAR